MWGRKEKVGFMKGKIKRLTMGTIAVMATLLLCMPICARAADPVPGKIAYSNFFRYQVMDEGTDNESACILSYTGKDTEITIPAEVNGIPVTTISDSAFKFRGTLTKITISEGIKTIGAEAFSHCTVLKEVDIPSTVEAIPQSAFDTCQKLETVNINTVNSKLKKIGEKAFYADLSLVDIKFPASLKEIGDNAFYGCSGIEQIELPKSLTTIGNRVFMHCSGITKAVIPEGTKAIGVNAFSLCTGLTEVSIPSTMVTIDDSAFETCEKLETVNINTKNCKLEKIGSFAFHDCDSLVNIEFPASLKEIGEGAFLKCNSLKKVDLQEGLETIGNSAFSRCNGLTEISVPVGVKSLGQLIFNQSNSVKTATIPAAMFDKDSLTTKVLESLVVLDDGTTSISDRRALVGKTELTDLVFPDSVTEIPTEFFSTCDALVNVELPADLKKIGDYAFSGCKAITTVDIPKGVTEIGEAAFGSCPLLSSVNIPDTVKTVGIGVFEGSPNMITDISKKYFNATVSGIVNKKYTGEPVTQDDITVEVNGLILTEDADYTVSYENNVEYGKASLYIEGIGKYTGSIKKEFTITDKETPVLTDISDAASKIRIKDFEDTFKYTGKAVTQKKMSLYKRTEAMTLGVDYKVTYSSNVNAGRAKMVITGIGAYTGTITKYFRIQIPKNAAYTVNGVKYVITNAATDGTGTVAFAGVTKKNTDKKFTSLTVSSAVRIGGVRFKVTRVKAKALSGYTYLKSVFIGDGVKVIEANAFYGCKALETITIGKGITSIGDKAFCRCTKLTKMVVKSTSIKSFGKTTFTLSGSKPVVYVPKAKLASYKKLISKSGMTAKAVYRGR